MLTFRMVKYVMKRNDKTAHNFFVTVYIFLFQSSKMYFELHRENFSPSAEAKIRLLSPDCKNT
jgi:hypothetical protein